MAAVVQVVSAVPAMLAAAMKSEPIDGVIRRGEAGVVRAGGIPRSDDLACGGRAGTSDLPPAVLTRKVPELKVAEAVPDSWVKLVRIICVPLLPPFVQLKFIWPALRVTAPMVSLALAPPASVEVTPKVLLLLTVMGAASLMA